MKENDYGMPLLFEVVDEDDEPVDLEEVTEIRLVRKLGGTVIERNCTVLENNIVRYIADEDFLDTSGLMKMEIRLIYPNQEYKSFNIKQLVRNKLE